MSPIRAVRRRIIPARAGFTTRTDAAWRDSMDHPRSRGVYFEAAFEVVPADGSSPLARGLRRTQKPTSPVGGIIPARAGFTANLP